ncbi:MAG TPA: 50S ribosomal protein L13 [Anaerolineae bacterium]|nr:50S ribosomal protein L13 [Anaerolineae bacterium]
MRTYTTKTSDINRKWLVVDADGQPLGRLATQIATILRGKHKPIYSPNVDCGDFVIVINAGKIHTTGRKLDQKMYYRHSGYPGGLTEITLRDQLQRYPTRPITDAVKGMLPKNKLGRQMIKKLKVYAGSEHPHIAQAPEVMKLS